MCLSKLVKHSADCDDGEKQPIVQLTAGEQDTG